MSRFQIFLVIVFLFFFGSFAGWVMELFFRRFLSKANPERKWLNPGFLYGPCVPLYGFGTVVLFSLSYFEQQLFGSFTGSFWYFIVMFFLMALAMTLIEYIAGILSLKVLHLRLWDYTDKWGNIQGIICPKFTLIWGIMSAVYYFLLYPKIYTMVGWFVIHPLSSFMVGVCFGIFVIDFAYSLHLGTALWKRAKEIDATVFESVDIQAVQRRMQSRFGFFRTLEYKPLTERIEEFGEFLHRKPETPVNTSK